MTTSTALWPANSQRRGDGPVIWQADYSQLELRIFAAVTKTRWMVDTFADPDGDIHKATAIRVLNVTPEQAKLPDVRTRAKTLNFGMSYGAQGETVEEQIITFALRNPELPIKIPTLAECKAMVKAYWAAAPEAEQWREFYLDVVRAQGYAETLYGRRRYLPHIRHSSSDLRSRAERQAINHVIQGTAGDIIKMAKLMLWREAEEYEADIRAQIHDELMGICHNPDLAPLWIEKVQEYMVLDQPLLPVPLKIEPKLIYNWKEAK